MYLKIILTTIILQLSVYDVLLAYSRDTTEKFMSFIPSMSCKYGNFKFKDVEQNKIPGYEIGLAGVINKKKVQIGLYYTISHFKTFNGGNIYYHNMSLANPKFGYYEGTIAINQWTFGTMYAYRFFSLKKFDFAGQLGTGLFGISNSIDSYNIDNIGISIVPALQMNYRLNNFLKIGALSYFNYSLSKSSKLNAVGISFQLILEIH
jgi:hypothetical protein